MEFLQNVVEYYDELYPVTDDIIQFYDSLKKTYLPPVKFLQIGCGTGALEHALSKDGSDVTGLEVSKELIAAANLRRRTQLTAVRFFQLSTLDMTRFLGKGFYNIISCLNSRIAFIHDKTLLRKFFFDSRVLISEKGTLVLELHHFRKEPEGQLPVPDRSSIRVAMSSRLRYQENGLALLDQSIQTGNGRILKVMDGEPVYPLTEEEIESFGREAGYTNFEFYSSFKKERMTDDAEKVICVIS